MYPFYILPIYVINHVEYGIDVLCAVNLIPLDEVDQAVETFHAVDHDVGHAVVCAVDQFVVADHKETHDVTFDVV
jgi:hypothetical protein